ncbi:MAG: ROK family protein [Micrococcales bacterium]|nr:ROK family protein [Micrococcales bacterium]MCL2668101.1 ROK family protein [Micrococcales bacterium]
MARAPGYVGEVTSEPFTLVVDCGGTGIKASVLDVAGTPHAPVARVATPYPLPPERFAETVVGLCDELPPAQRATVGMPGMVRRGVVLATPHYVKRHGPRSSADPELVAAWKGFDIQALLTTELGIETLVLNDAQVHGAGVVSGTGVELVLTLGTGLGWALFAGGRLAPHLEMSQAPFTRATTYDSYIGEPERVRLGDGLWSRRVRRVVEHLRPVVMWDRLYLGGGNSRRITPTALQRLGDDVVVVPNAAGIVGGVRAWTMPH